jgi:hypothetical protein
MSQIPFVCPNCGGDKFRLQSEPNIPDDMVGAPCAGCGTPLTQEEFEQQHRKYVDSVIERAFKKIDSTI